MKHYVLSIICYLLVTNSYAEEEACISNGFTTTCSKIKRSKEIESAYDNVIDFFKIGNSNIKIAKKIYDKQLTPNESSIHSYHSEINKISKLQNNINWRKYLNELENYCTTELKNIYDNDALDRDLAEKANKVYSFSLFKQSGQMDTEFYEIKGEQDSRNIKRCKQLAINELNLQKPIYEEKISARNIEIQRQEREKEEALKNIAIEKNNKTTKNIKNQPELSPLEFLKSKYMSIMSLRDCRDSRKGYQKQYISEGIYQEALSAIRQIEKDAKKQIANLDEKKAWSEASEEYSNTMLGGGLFSIKSNTTWNEGFEQICLLAYFDLIASAKNAPKPVKEKDF